MVEARSRAFAREHNGRAWLAFHITHLPHQKRPVSLSDLMIRTDAAPAARGQQSGEEIQTMMLRWRFAMAGTSTQRPRAPLRRVAHGTKLQQR